MTIKITDKEKRLILDGLRIASALLRDYSHSYAMNHDADNARDCLHEAGMYDELANKIERETAK